MSKIYYIYAAFSISFRFITIFLAKCYHTIRAYLLLRFPWLMTGPEPVDFYYIGVNDAMMKVFRAETKRGSFVDFMYNQYQEVQWFKELLTWPFPEEHPEVEHEMYNVLYGGSKNA